MAVAPVPAAIITLKTRQIGRFNAIYLGPEVLVESECKPGTWYRVEGATCSCPGNVYHGHCKHVAVAQTAAQIDERESVAVLPDPDPWTDGTPHPVTGLVWAGYRRGWLAPEAL